MASWLKRTLGIAAVAVSAIAVSTAVIASVSRQSVSPRFFARVEAGNWVTLIHPTSDATRRVYHSAASAVAGLAIAPSQDRLTFIEVNAGRALGEPPTHQLVVIDSMGRVVSRIERNVRLYTWCGAECLAYIVGEDYEGGVGFMPKGAFRLDLQTGTETAIEGIPAPYALMWAPFDTSVYFKSFARPNGANVIRYSLLSGLVTATPYRDFHFSPSGKHYLQPRDGANDTIRLYETATNRLVPLPISTALGEPGGWVFDHGDYLLFGRRLPPRLDPGGEGIRRGIPGPMEYAIYDVTSRRIVRKVPGERAPWVGPRGVLPILVGGRLHVLQKP
jgi:hypothetical protein